VVVQDCKITEETAVN